MKATESGCISSLPSSAPNRYSAPLRYEQSRDQAYRRVRAALSERGNVDGAGPEYLHARLQQPEEVDVEFHFVEDEPVVTYRLMQPTPTIATPFCFSRGCVNGNQNLRGLIERLRDETGWRFEDARFETERYEGWVPIFLH